MGKTDYSLINLVATVRGDKTRIWNAVEIYNLCSPQN